MADLTIHELQNEATTPAADDYMVQDGATAGTRKITPANLATWIHNKWAAFINAITPIKTSFASGDKIPVVNGSTATAMSKDTLLELTAQNALGSIKDLATTKYKGFMALDDADGTGKMDVDTIFNNFAPKFVPNSTTTVAGQPYMYNGLMYVAKEAYQGVWDASKFTGPKNAFDANLILNPSIDGAPYNDLNTFPINSIVAFTSPSIAAQNILNNPSGRQFHCYTFAADSGVRTQILSDSANNTFIRSKWGGIWSSWKNFNNINEIVLNPSASSAPYNDLNTFPINSIVAFTTSSIPLTNNPSGKQFHCYTFATYSDVRTQILSDSEGDTYIRSKWGGIWSKWRNLSVQGMTDVLCEFDNILFVGDSLTYSQVYTGNNIARQAKKTYPKVIEEITGSTTFNLSNPGDTAADAWTRWKDSFEAKTNALAVIYLGTNQGLTDTLSEDAPENDPYTDWADTNTGCYAKIVAKLQELGYKILLIKPYSFTTSGAVYTAQLVIDEIGERFGCAVVGPIRNNDKQYHYWPNLQNYDQVHYNDLGYAWFAYRLVQEVSLIGEGLKYIIPE